MIYTEQRRQNIGNNILIACSTRGCRASNASVEAETQSFQICPVIQVNEMHAFYEHHKVFSFLKTHQNTQFCQI